jgi:hypothetical protein
MPEIVAVPSPLSMRVTPAGRGPVSVSDGAGNPRVVTVKVPESPRDGRHRAPAPPSTEDRLRLCRILVRPPERPLLYQLCRARI